MSELPVPALSRTEGLRLDLLRSTEELETFAPAWQKLWAADPRATPFQSPAWLLPWWRQFGQPELRSVRIHANGVCAGFLPFYVYREPTTGERQLLLLGVGTSDYLDGVFAPNCTVEHIRQAIELLLEDDSWDVMLCIQLMPESKLLQAMRQIGAKESFDSESCCRMPAVAMVALPQKIRRNAMYYRNRALREGALEFLTADTAGCASAFEDLRRLHTGRWRQRGLPGVLADERVLAWHREALPWLAWAGILRLCTLRLNGKPLGVLYSLIDPPTRAERRQYFYITAYSTARSDLRPGSLLLAFAIDQAARESVQVIDMLRGEEAYKQIWHLERTSTYGFALRRQAARQKTATAAVGAV